MREQIEARRAALIQEREQFIASANQRLAQYAVVINELETLLAPAEREQAVEWAPEPEPEPEMVPPAKRTTQ